MIDFNSSMVLRTSEVVEVVFLKERGEREGAWDNRINGDALNWRSLNLTSHSLKS